MNYIEPTDVYTQEELEALIESGNTIPGSISVRGEYLSTLGRVEKIVGDLGVGDAKLQSLGSLKEVTGNVWFSFGRIDPLIRDLGVLERVGGSINLMSLQIKSLGNLRTVGGSLNLRNAQIEDLGVLERVGGSLSLPKSVQGKIDLSGIEIGGSTKYYKSTVEALAKENPRTSLELVESEIPVPLWKKSYASSSSYLTTADEERKRFYDYFKRSFLDGRIVDVRGNANYVFGLMFDLLKDYRSHRNEEIVTSQLEALENAYPAIRPYALENLVDAFKGMPEKPGIESFGEIKIEVDLTQAFGELRDENPGWFVEDEDAEGDSLDRTGEHHDVEEDEDDAVDSYVPYNTLKFPPSSPVFTVILERVVENQKTHVIVNGSRIDTLNADVASARADLRAGRLFLHTRYEQESEDSHSIFCFELSTGRRLWQTLGVQSDGELYIDPARELIEAGVTYDYEDNYLVMLDYAGNVVARNFQNGYEMIQAADEKFKNEEFVAAKELYSGAVVRKISTSTKLKAAKKLVRIGKLTGDDELSECYSKMVAELTLEKGEEATTNTERKERNALPLRERFELWKRDGETGRETLQHIEKPQNEYQKKREMQRRKDGGR